MDKDTIIKNQAARIAELEKMLNLNVKNNQDNDFVKTDNEFKEALGMQ